MPLLRREEFEEATLSDRAARKEVDSNLTDVLNSKIFQSGEIYQHIISPSRPLEHTFPKQAFSDCLYNLLFSLLLFLHYVSILHFPLLLSTTVSSVYIKLHK